MGGGAQGGESIDPVDVVVTSLSMTEEIQMCISSIGNQLSWFAWDMRLAMLTGDIPEVTRTGAILTAGKSHKGRYLFYILEYPQCGVPRNEV